MSLILCTLCTKVKWSRLYDYRGDDRTWLRDHSVSPFGFIGCGEGRFDSSMRRLGWDPWMNGWKSARAYLRPCREEDDGLIGADLRHLPPPAVLQRDRSPGRERLFRKSPRLNPDMVRLASRSERNVGAPRNCNGSRRGHTDYTRLSSGTVHLPGLVGTHNRPQTAPRPIPLGGCVGKGAQAAIAACYRRDLK
jgi:hypothetical protein